MNKNELSFRKLTTEDLPMLAEWLARPHVRQWWGSPQSVAEIEAEYGDALGSDLIVPYVALLDGEAIGFIQSYVVKTADPEWWTEETDPGARGIDQFLADASALGRGLGTRMVRAFVGELFFDPAVTKVQTDPDPSNARAIRCYEKAGFERVGVVKTPDGPALLMVAAREKWS